MGEGWGGGEKPQLIELLRIINENNIVFIVGIIFIIGGYLRIRKK